MKEDTIEIKGNKEFTLPNERITVKFIGRRKGMAANVGADHVISGGMLSNAVKRFGVPLQRNGSLKNVLTEPEKTFLEQVTGLNLSVYGDFWRDYRVALYKDDANNQLDLSNPLDYISYKILLFQPDDIAHNWNDRNKKQTYQFAITRSDEEMLEKKQGYDSKREAFTLFGRIMDDREKLIGVLKLLTNKPISKDSKLEWIQERVGEFIDTMPYSFINVVNDSSFYTKMLINSAIDLGVIVKSGNKYATADGLDLCNAGEVATFDNTVNYLDNPKNQEVRDIIEAKITKAKK